MARKPPCECGHPHRWHLSDKGWCVPPDDRDWDDCLAYVPAKRTQPLRAKRQWAPSNGRIEVYVDGVLGPEATGRLLRLLSEIAGPPDANGQLPVCIVERIR